MSAPTFADVGSGLIYAVIIGMWVAYFIPLWLRRHEERAEARSADRFSHAMRILSRRHAAGDQKQPSPTPVRAGGALTSVGAPRHSPHSSRGVGDLRRQPSKLAFRRRRILAALFVLACATAAAAPLSAVTWQMAAGTLCATLIYLIHLRLQARRSRQLSRTRQSIRRRSLARLSRLESADRIFHARRALRAERAAAAAERVAEAARAEGHRQSDGWQPVPVPLPTYVTKPVAPPHPAERPGGDHREPFDQTAVAPPVPKAPSEDADELSEIIERRRAVND